MAALAGDEGTRATLAELMAAGGHLGVGVSTSGGGGGWHGDSPSGRTTSSYGSAAGVPSRDGGGGVPVPSLTTSLLGPAVRGAVSAPATAATGGRGPLTGQEGALAALARTPGLLRELSNPAAPMPVASPAISLLQSVSGGTVGVTRGGGGAGPVAPRTSSGGSSGAIPPHGGVAVPTSLLTTTVGARSTLPGYAPTGAPSPGGRR